VSHGAAGNWMNGVSGRPPENRRTPQDDRRRPLDDRLTRVDMNMTGGVDSVT